MSFLDVASHRYNIYIFLTSELPSEIITMIFSFIGAELNKWSNYTKYYTKPSFTIKDKNIINNNTNSIIHQNIYSEDVICKAENYFDDLFYNNRKNTKVKDTKFIRSSNRSRKKNLRNNENKYLQEQLFSIQEHNRWFKYCNHCERLFRNCICSEDSYSSDYSYHENYCHECGAYRDPYCYCLLDLINQNNNS